MPYWTPERLQKIIEIARRLDILTDTSDHSLTPAHQLGIDADKRTLRDVVVPETIYIVTQADSGGYRAPVVWAPVEDELWEFLEHAAYPELLSVRELTQEGGEAKDITTDFCDRWLEAVADYTLDRDDFFMKLPEFIDLHFGDEPSNRWNAAHRHIG